MSQQKNPKSKQDIEPLNDNDEPHGYHEIYFNNGELAYKCNYVNGNEVGYEEWYDGRNFYLR